jgi:hypothetical protein
MSSDANKKVLNERDLRSYAQVHIDSAADSIISGRNEEERERQRLERRNPGVKPLRQPAIDEDLEMRRILVVYINENQNFITRKFFITWLWDARLLFKVAQEKMMKAIDLYANNIANARYQDGRLFVLGTGSGKSLAIDYLAAACLGTTIQPVIGKGRIFTLLVACSTIILSVEHFVRLQKANASYYDTIFKNPDLYEAHKDRLPQLFTYTSKHGAKKPMYLVKLLAGGDGSLSILYELYQQLGTQRDGAQTKRQVVVIVGTYENIAFLLARADEPVGNHPPWNGITLRSCFGALIVDEAHHVRGGRPAAWAVQLWAKYRDLWTIYLTATATADLAKYLNVRQPKLVDVRVHSRIVFNFPVLADDAALVQDALHYGFLGYIQALTHDHNRRTAIFVENKMLLKIIVCLLAYDVSSKTIRYSTNEQLLEGQAYATLASYIKVDPAIACDHIQYGQMVDADNHIPFYDAFLYLAMRGVLVVTADISSSVRKKISTILSSAGMKWAVVLATSAVAEGNNMKMLKSVFVLVKQPPSKGFFPVYKVIQEIGRVDREDLGGIAYCPDPEKLGSPVYRTFPITSVGEIVGSGIPVSTFSNLFSLSVEDNVPKAITLNNILSLPHFACFTENEEYLTAMVKTCPAITGYLYTPYYFADKIVKLQAFVAKLSSESDVGYVMPTLMTKIIKHFQQDEHFNFSIFLLTKGEALALSYLPVIAQLGLFVVYLTMPQYNAKSNYQLIRKDYYTTFIDNKMKRIRNIPTLWDMYMIIKNVSHIFPRVRIPKDDANNITIFKAGMPQTLFSNEPEAIALFITEIITADSDWEIICGQWGVYRPFYGNFMQNLDLLVSLLLDKPFLPIADLLTDVFAKITYTCPGINCNQLSLITKDVHAMKLSMGKQRRDIVCGIITKEYPEGYPPCNIPNDVISTYTCLENVTLVTIMSAAIHVKDFLMLTDVITFRDRRQQNSNPTTQEISPLHTEVSMPLEDGALCKLRPLTFDQYHRVLSISNTPFDEDVVSVKKGNAQLRPLFTS